MLTRLSRIQLFRRLIIFSLATALIASSIAITLFLLVIYSPTEIAHRFFALARLSAQIEKISWTGRSSLYFQNIRFQEKFTLRSLHLDWSWRRGLDGFVTLDAEEFAWGDAARVERLHGQWQWRELFFNSLIRTIEIEGVELWSDKITRQDPRDPKDKTPFSKASEALSHQDLKPRWAPRVSTLTLKRATLFLENLLPEIYPIPLYFAQEDPIILNDIHLAPLRDQPISDTLYRASTGGITLYSPYDALLPVISIESMELAFSWNALRQNVVNEFIILRPTLYIGPGLFWLADAIEKKRAAAQKSSLADTPSVWTIQNFLLRDGTLNIAAWGGQGFLIPMRFQSSFRDLRTDRLKDLSLRNTMIFDPLTATYPEYKLSLNNLRGEINFSLPLASNANNLVPTLFLDKLEWNELTAENLYLSVTFDPRGIYGLIGGHAYKGQIHGGFNIGYKAGFPWTAWITADKVELFPITKRITGETFTLTGPLQGQLIAKGKGKTVSECSGSLTLKQPGEMKIRAITHLIDRLPADWGQPKQALIQSVLESFSDYSYTHGSLKWRYAIPKSNLRLLLKSPRGNQDFTVHWDQLPHEP